MGILFGKSYENGIDFYVEYKNEKFVVSAINEGDAINVEKKDNSFKRNETNKEKNKFYLAIIAIIFTALYTFFGKSNLMIVACFWMFATGYFIVNNKKNVNKKVFKYHAVEHKIINYYSKYGRVPTKREEIENEDSVLLFCGTTLLTVLMVLISCLILVFSMISNIFVAFLIFVSTVCLTVFLWLCGNLNFFQKLSIREPSEEEIKLGVKAMEKFLEICESYTE